MNSSTLCKIVAIIALVSIRVCVASDLIGPYKEFHVPGRYSENIRLGCVKANINAHLKIKGYEDLKVKKVKRSSLQLDHEFGRYEFEATPEGKPSTEVFTGTFWAETYEEDASVIPRHYDRSQKKFIPAQKTYRTVCRSAYATCYDDCSWDSETVMELSVKGEVFHKAVSSCWNPYCPGSML